MKILTKYIILSFCIFSVNLMAEIIDKNNPPKECSGVLTEDSALNIPIPHASDNNILYKNIIKYQGIDGSIRYLYILSLKTKESVAENVRYYTQETAKQLTSQSNLIYHLDSTGGQSSPKFSFPAITSAITAGMLVAVNTGSPVMAVLSATPALGLSGFFAYLNHKKSKGLFSDNTTIDRILSDALNKENNIQYVILYQVKKQDIKTFLTKLFSENNIKIINDF